MIISYPFSKAGQQSHLELVERKWLYIKEFPISRWGKNTHPCTLNKLIDSTLHFTSHSIFFLIMSGKFSTGCNRMRTGFAPCGCTSLATAVGALARRKARSKASVFVYPEGLMRTSSQRDFVALLRHPLPLPWGPWQEERHEAKLRFLYIRKTL